MIEKFSKVTVNYTPSVQAEPGLPTGAVYTKKFKTAKDAYDWVVEQGSGNLSSVEFLVSIKISFNVEAIQFYITDLP